MPKQANILRMAIGWIKGISAPDVDTEATLPDSTKGSPERPIVESSRDVLERGGFVERLASALIGRKTGQASGIVLGLTGSWGSGKSSLLNLLAAHIREKYPNSALVRFDPWLVSGRNDLIVEFIGELLAAIKLKAGWSYWRPIDRRPGRNLTV